MASFNLITLKTLLVVFNPLTGDFMVTVSDINGLFLLFLYKIYSKTSTCIVYQLIEILLDTHKIFAAHTEKL